MTDWKKVPHRRLNPLTGEWVLVSPHRTARPWQGQVEKLPAEDQPAYDPKCYLCPGNSRAGDARNPKYASTFAFDNDFGALLPDIETTEFAEGPLVRARTERGVSRVVCFSPNHSLTIARMQVPEIRIVVDTWIDEYKALGGRPYINY